MKMATKCMDKCNKWITVYLQEIFDKLNLNNLLVDVQMIFSDVI